MKQPNTHHIRRFIDRSAGVGVGQSTAFTHKELVDVSLGLNDLLLYQRELELENRDLKEQIANSDKIDIEMVGDKF
jgi:hypothetical protein